MSIAAILIIALFAFELFNFDTTRFALRSLLGSISFGSASWAGILALAFCSIDFAGLAYLLTPESERESLPEAWYLTAAWLLGASMNAVMTWWAVSLALLDQPLGNEILTRAELLRMVPIFVAVLVWLTRILFIGAVSAAGEKLLAVQKPSVKKTAVRKAPVKAAVTLRPIHNSTNRRTPISASATPVRPALSAAGRTGPAVSGD